MQVIVFDKRNRKIYYDDIVSIIRFSSVLKFVDNNGYTMTWSISDIEKVEIESLEWL